MTGRRRRAALVAAAIAVASAVPAALVLSLRTGDLFGAAFSSSFVAYGGIGLLILWKRPANAVGRLLVVLGLVVPLGQVLAGYAVLRLPGAQWAAWTSSLTFAVVFGSLLIFLPLLFPTGTYLSPRWRRFGRFAVVELGMLTLVFALAPGRLDCCPEFRNPIDLQLLRPLERVIPLLFSVVAATAVVAFASVVLRYRRSRGEERLQMKWFVFAVAWIVLAAVGGALASVGVVPESDLVPIVVFPSAVTAIAVAVGIAVLRYRLYGIDLVINKTLVYGALAAFITAVYVGVVVGLGSVISTRGEPNLGLQVAATALVAVAFQPVRARVQRFANRLVYGRRSSPYETLTAFSGRVAGTYAAEDVLPRMARIVAEGTGAREASVWLRFGAELRQAARWPPDDGRPDPVAVSDDEVPSVPGADRTLAVRHRGELLGALAIGKSPGDPVRSQEESLLSDLASQAGLVLRNVRLAEELRARLEEVSRLAGELRRSRRRLVATQDASRRKLERDIHDGAQQHLVALAVQLKLAQTVAAKDPAKARPLLEGLVGATNEALANLRDLTRGVYPPLLESEGLAAALRSEAERTVVPVRVEAEGIDRLSLEVEGAVYFSILEAVQNAAKYARAPWVEVTVIQRDDALTFSVVDHGAGFDPAATPRGTGIQNMADRLQTLGGEVEVRSAPGQGTTVSGRIPLRQVAEVP